MPFAATWMELEIVSQREKDKYRMDHLYAKSHTWTHNLNELIYETEVDSQTSKTGLWLPGEKAEGKGGRIGSLGLTDAN